MPRDRPVAVHVTNGAVWHFLFRKLVCKEARLVGTEGNQLGGLLREWFGEQAGMPGSAHYVSLRWEGDELRALPERPET